MARLQPRPTWRRRRRTRPCPSLGDERNQFPSDNDLASEHLHPFPGRDKEEDASPSWLARSSKAVITAGSGAIKCYWLMLEATFRRRGSREPRARARAPFNLRSSPFFRLRARLEWEAHENDEGAISKLFHLQCSGRISRCNLPWYNRRRKTQRRMKSGGEESFFRKRMEVGGRREKTDRLRDWREEDVSEVTRVRSN